MLGANALKTAPTQYLINKKPLNTRFIRSDYGGMSNACYWRFLLLMNTVRRE